MSYRILIGDASEQLRTLEPESVQTAITSPPYWGLRDYGTAAWEGGDPECDHTRTEQQREQPERPVWDGTFKNTKRSIAVGYAEVCGKCGATRIDSQLGLEPTPGAYVANLVEVFREVRRVLRDDGTLWLNLGDSYASQPAGNKTPSGFSQTRPSRQKHGVGPETVDLPGKQFGCKPKDLVGIPWMVAFALRADGWVLRQEVIWQKPNPMPESVTDRCTRSHEQIFMFSKAKWSGPEPGRFAHISDQDARWLALFLDTEGNITVKRGQSRGKELFGIQVAVAGCHRPLLEAAQQIVGSGNIAERAGTNAPVHYWQVSNKAARDLLLRLYPYLIVKRRQARIGIYLESLLGREGQTPSAKRSAELERLWQANKSCNSFGDPDLAWVPEPRYGRWASARYFYDADAIAEPSDGRTHHDLTGPGYAAPGQTPQNGNRKQDAIGREQAKMGGGDRSSGFNERYFAQDAPATRNRRSVWTVTTQPYSEAHFATFPPKLIEPCILAGSAKGDTVLDPFSGAGTTGLVALRHDRDYIGIELNPEYAEMSRQRLYDDAPLLNVEAA